MPRQNPAIVAIDRRLAAMDERRKALEAEHLAIEESITSLRAVRDEAAAAVRKRAKKPADKPACAPSA